MRARILIVEDEPDLANLLAYNLRREHYATDIVGTGTDALARLDDEPPPDLILLDRMLPDISGDAVLRNVRERETLCRVPVLMVSARDAEQERVAGLAMGADDYMVKPFSVRELLLRIRAILRRHRPAGPAVEIDTEGCQARVGGALLSLTPLEFGVLSSLADGALATREQLVEAAWNDPVTVTLSVVDHHVKRLRRKLEPHGYTIATVRGAGYRLELTGSS